MLYNQNNTLHLIDTFWLGGAQRVVQALFEQNQANTTIFLHSMRITEAMISIKHQNVSCSPNPKKWNFNVSIDEVKNIIEQNQITLLHCHLPKSQLIGLIMKLFYFNKLKLIFHEQGDIMDSIPNNYLTYIVGRKAIDQVVCCSSAVKKSLLLKTGFSKSKVKIIYNFNSLEFTKRVLFDRKKVTSIGFIGRIEARKGWRTLIMAFFYLVKKSTFQNLKLHIAGIGSELAEMEKLIKSCNLEQQIELHGFIEDREAFYTKIDLLCMPSIIEPMGMVHVEAMSRGIPVIASNIIGMKEVLKDEINCLFFKVKDKNDLCEKMIKMIDNSELRSQLIENGYETAEKFSYRYFEKELNRVYHNLQEVKRNG